MFDKAAGLVGANWVAHAWRQMWAPRLDAHDPDPPIPIGADSAGYDGLGSANTPTPQLVLVSGDEDARRVDHHSRLFFGRASAAAPPQPQRLPFMQKAAALLATLGLLEAEAAFARVDQQKLHAFRSPPAASGHFLLPVSRIIPFGSEADDAERIDHYGRLFFGRGTQQQVGQPWLMWKRAAADQSVEEFTPSNKVHLLHLYRVGYQTVGQPNLYRFPKAKAGQDTELVDARVNHTRLHFYRVGYQTVGQPNLYKFPRAIAGQDVEPDAVRVDHDRLHLYRVGFQTVGQSWSLWPRTQTRIDAEEWQQPKPVDLTPYRGQYPAAAGPGQPWYLWPTAEAWQDVEPDAQRTDHYRRLFFGRTTPAQGGHFLLPYTQLVLVTEDRDAQRIDHYRSMFGRSPPVVVVQSQPFFLLWQPAEVPPEIEQEAHRTDHGRLHLYRVGYQTVGQPWALWSRQKRHDEVEQPFIQRPVDLTPFRGQYPAVAGAGQPWYLWKPAKADQSVEPDAKRTDYSAMFFYRFEITIPPQLTGGEWIIRARRRRNR